MIQFAKEPLTDALWAEAWPLLQAHWKEVAHYQDIPLDPDREVYAASEEAGILRCFTARTPATFGGEPCRILASEVGGNRLIIVDGYECSNIVPAAKVVAGELVGYALYFVRPAPHYSTSLQAVNDVVYLAPNHRGRTFLKFMAFCHEQMSDEGVQATYLHIKTALPAAHRALEHLGYEVVEKIYAKRLDSHVSPSKESSLGWKGQAQLDYDTARFVGIKP